MGIKYTVPHLWKEDEPDCWEPLKYDPEFGFKEPRKPKVMEITKEEMDSANMAPFLRDSCVYYRMRYHGCMYRESPFWPRCEGFKQEQTDCAREELLHDMKEFEREKRLNARERRIAQMNISD